METRRGFWAPRTEVTDDFWLLCGYWKPPLQEQQMLAAEPSLLSFVLCVCVFVDVYRSANTCHKRPEEGGRSLGTTGVTGHCEPLSVGAGNLIQVVWKSSKHWAISYPETFLEGSLICFCRLGWLQIVWAGDMAQQAKALNHQVLWPEVDPWTFIVGENRLFWPACLHTLIIWDPPAPGVLLFVGT